jgi:hypothetical protein
VFLGASLVWEGDLPAGVAALNTAAGQWGPHDAGGNLRARALGAMWSQLGLARLLQGRQAESDEAIAQALRAGAGDPYARCLTATMTAVTAQLAGRTAATRAAIEPVWMMALDLSTDFWLTWAQALLGWALAGEPEDTGLAMMAEAIDHSSSRQAMPYFCYLLGSRLLEHGDAEAALPRVDHGLTVATETGEHVWTPLLLLVRARTLTALGRDDEAAEAALAARERARHTGSQAVVEWCDDWLARAR